MADKILYESKPSLRKEYLVTLGCGVGLLVLRYLTGLQSLASMVLLLPLFAVFAYLIMALVRVSCTLYRITDQYVEVSEGIVARRLKRAPWLKITNFSTDQTAAERLLGLVNIRIDTAGHDRWEVEFQGLGRSDAIQILALLEEYVPDAQGPAESPPAAANEHGPS